MTAYPKGKLIFPGNTAEFGEKLRTADTIPFKEDRLCETPLLVNNILAAILTGYIKQPDRLQVKLPLPTGTGKIMKPGNDS